MYIIKIDAESNTIVVGDRKELYKTCLIASNPQWINQEMIKESSRFKVKIRSRHHPKWATVMPFENGRLKVLFDQPQMAITPGQLAVFYTEDTVMGSAWIENVVT